MSFDSDQSLADAGIIVFTPTLDPFIELSWESYRGNSLVSEDSAPRLLKRIAHWKHELARALNAGKTVFVYLVRPEECYYETGEKQFSGTGRNRQTTKLVAPMNSYESLPVNLPALAVASGTKIRRAPKSGVISEYWHNLGEQSRYECYFGPIGLPLLLAGDGSDICGALVDERGALVLLPTLDLDEEDLTEHDAKRELVWSKTGLATGELILASLLSIHRNLRGGSSTAPEWAAVPNRMSPREAAQQLEADQLQASMADLDGRLSALREQQADAAVLRRLLYETGSPLEDAILVALRLMGFVADRVVEGHSEFDAVFVSEEGRFLGEAEGKDGAAINVDKLRQLESNLQEDFARDDVDNYAKGVLFGNAYRLQPVAERKEFFTQKVKDAARRSGIALVRTPDLWPVAAYLESTPDSEFATSCRAAIASAGGEVVQFPPVPDTKLAAQLSSNDKADRGGGLG